MDSNISFHTALATSAHTERERRGVKTKLKQKLFCWGGGWEFLGNAALRIGHKADEKE